MINLILACRNAGKRLNIKGQSKGNTKEKRKAQTTRLQNTISIALECCAGVGLIMRLSRDAGKKQIAGNIRFKRMGYLVLPSASTELTKNNSKAYHPQNIAVAYSRRGPQR